VRGIALLVNRYLRAAGITDRSGPHVRATPSPPTPCVPGPTSARCRSCWVTPG
jgi:hypothetical protein